MTSTSFRYDAFTGRENAASLHIRVGGAWEPRIEYDPTTQAPAGAASSSVRDLATWMRLELAHGALDGEQVIDAAAIDATHVPPMARGRNPITGGASFYGLGWNVEFGRHGMTWGHAGAFSYGRTVVTLLPESGLGIVVLANAFPSGVPGALSDSFFDLVLDGELAQDYLRGTRSTRACSSRRSPRRRRPSPPRPTPQPRRCRPRPMPGATPTPTSARRRWSRRGRG